MLNHGYASTHEAVFSKFQALLKELEGKRFEDEARCLDVFVLGEPSREVLAEYLRSFAVSGKAVNRSCRLAALLGSTSISSR